MAFQVFNIKGMVMVTKNFIEKVDIYPNTDVNLIVLGEILDTEIRMI